MPILEHSIAAVEEKKKAQEILNSKRKNPVVQKVPGGLKVMDCRGYFRIAKDWKEAGEFAQRLNENHNSVITMNSFEAAKWHAPEEETIQ